MREQPGSLLIGRGSQDDDTGSPRRMVGESKDDALTAFADEGTGLPPPRSIPAVVLPSASVEAPFVADPVPTWPLTSAPRRQAGWVAAGLAFVLMMTGAYALWSRQQATGSVAVEGTATITSRPEGLQVVIDDDVRGTTPIKLNLPLGTHRLQIGQGVDVRALPLVVEAGTSVSQYIDFGPTAAPLSTGRLDVTSEPPGAAVRVDGAVAGTTPLTLAAIPAGEHVILIGAGDSTVKRMVTVLPGAAASIDASVSQAAVRAGWVSLKTPFDMEVREGGRLIGTTAMDRIMLPAGSHTLELVSTPTEFRTTASVRIAAGATSTTIVAVPNGLLSVNAVPWATVEVDGRSIGTTPLANIPIPIGSHEIVWKHPQHGERKQTVSVRANTPARVGMDLTQ
jgi:hypothetical protein